MGMPSSSKRMPNPPRLKQFQRRGVVKDLADQAAASPTFTSKLNGFLAILGVPERPPELDRIIDQLGYDIVHYPDRADAYEALIELAEVLADWVEFHRDE